MILASRQQIEQYTQQGVWGEKTLIEDFRGHARTMPTRTAIVDPPNKEGHTGTAPERITYAELDKAVESTAAALREAGIGKDDVVLVQLPNCWELAMLYLAVARAGGTISPVPMQWRKKEIGYVCDLARARAFFTVEEFHGFAHGQMGRELAEKTECLEKVFSFADLRAMAQSGGALDPGDMPVGGNDIFTICWTSGTEARPKGCPLSHNNWRCQSSLALAGGAEPGDVMLTAGPLVNMASVGTVFIPWILYGGTMVLHHPFDPALLLKQMVEEQINYTLLVPAVVNLILKHPMAEGIDLSSIRSITVGSAPPSLWAMEEFKKRWDIDIGNIWGQNEGTAIISGVEDVPDMQTRVNCLPRYGAPGITWSIDMASRIQTKLVDAEGRELTEEGAVGELLYRGPNVIPGYFNRPDLNEKAFDKEGYIHTGDLFRLAGDRYLQFFDRAKDIIIRGGYNISAQEVENTLLAHPKVQDIAAVGMPDDSLGERVCVYAVPAPGQELALSDLTEYMREQGVAVYKFPERLEVVESLPRNPVGKLLKKDLREDLRGRIEQE